ncbi:MAG: AraC family transcriptional regulator [Burkholderiaceae bacterium]
MSNAQHPLATLFPNEPLNTPNRQLFASHDLEETRAMVGRVMKQHQLGVAGNAKRLDARMHHLALGDITLSRLRYGADVNIRPGPLEDFFLVQMPLVGHARIENGSQSVDSCPDLASVLSPDDATVMRWGADSDQVMIRIERSLLERSLAAQLGRPMTEPLKFQLGFRWRECVPWRCLMSYLLDCSTQDQDLAQHKLIAAQMQQMVVTTLLSMHAHNYTDAPPPRRSAILPRHVRRVQEYLQAHAHEPVCADELAQLAGVSLRSLYAGFKDFCGVSPMQYLKDLRLDRARADLLSAGDVCNVAGVAMRWGFTHLGRFSSDYRTRFGENPRQSLRRH